MPENTLSTDNSTIYYQLPKEIKIQAEETGTVTNTGGTIIGNYTIDTNGLISITFTDESYIAGNSSSELIGYIAFQMEAADFLQDNPDGNGITFSDGVSVTIQPDDVITGSDDLKVEKTITSYNDKTGEITYTVTVTSKGGTNKAVTLTDTGFASIASITSLTDDSGKIEVSKYDSDGKLVSSESISIDTSSVSDGFTMTLPAMVAGTTYTFSYTTKLNSMVFTGTKTENNTITVESRNTMPLS